MMSRPLRLVAAVFILLVLLVVFHRSSSIQYDNLRMPKGWNAHTLSQEDAQSPNDGFNPNGAALEHQSLSEGEQAEAEKGDKAPVAGSPGALFEPQDPNAPEKQLLDGETAGSVNAGGKEPDLPKEGAYGGSDAKDKQNPDASLADADAKDVDWSRFAYVQYVTNTDYLCNSVMIFEALHRLGSKPDRVLMYPSFMLAHPDAERGPYREARLLIKARDDYNAKLVPISVEYHEGQDATWADSYTKLLAFNQTKYDRVLSLDSDATLLKPMDDLFLLPPYLIAMPRAYWLLKDSKKKLSSQVMLLQPSVEEFERVQDHIDSAGENEYDMEIANHLYLDSALVLPHRKYALMSSEFRAKDHKDYLGSDTEAWDPAKVLAEAKYVHFSDSPLPKPWLSMTDEDRKQHQPECKKEGDKEVCTDREIWNSLYENFAKQRHLICNVDEKPANE